MSAPKSRTTNEILQRIMGSFKQFEKKIDKLQEDVSSHGQTLEELRHLVAHISGSTLELLETRTDEGKRLQQKTAGIQYDNYVYDPPLFKPRRKNAIRALPTKLKAKSVQIMHNDGAYIKNRLLANAKGLPGKHSSKNIRHSKAEAPRKATTLRTQKQFDCIRKTVLK